MCFLPLGQQNGTILSCFTRGSFMLLPFINSSRDAFVFNLDSCFLFLIHILWEYPVSLTLTLSGHWCTYLPRAGRVYGLLSVIQCFCEPGETCIIVKAKQTLLRGQFWSGTLQSFLMASVTCGDVFDFVSAFVHVPRQRACLLHRSVPVSW